MKKTNTLTILLVTIILTIVLVALVNVGLSLFNPYPDYNTLCPNNNQIGITCTAYDSAVSMYNNINFFTLAGLGVILVLIALFISISFILYTGLLSGLILIGQAIVMNWNNKILVFISLIIVLILIGLGTWKALKKMK